MVGNASIAMMIISLLLSLLVPVGLIIYFRVNVGVSFKAVGVGALIFALFALVLERLLHWYMLQVNPNTIEFLRQPLWFALYGALAAGIFEEVGRYAGFRLLLPGLRRWRDGLAYGLGHGGFESVLIGAVSVIPNLLYAFYINAGIFESKLGAQLPDYLLLKIRADLISSPAYLFSVGGIERLFALLIQIGLSLMVLYGVKNGRIVYLLYAILLHALIDFPAALYQAGQLNIWLVEGFLIIAAALFSVYVLWAWHLFGTPAEKAGMDVRLAPDESA
jgi:uncharacterized membrane protein YhfC